VVAAFPGCGGYKPPYGCTKVSGTVTYDDGSLIPAERIRLIFVSQAPPLDPKTPPKNGLAEADVKTGKFAGATTFDYNDGIIAGEHKVLVNCWGNGKLIPDEYRDVATTPLKVKSSDSPFHFKIPKPH